MIEINGQKQTIALTLLVKNETDVLRKMFESIQPCRAMFDEIVCGWTGDSPETKAILDQYCTRVFPVEWKWDHGDARNQVHEAVETDLVMWLDADDQLGIRGEKLGEILPLPQGYLEPLIATAFADQTVGALWFEYLYGYDKDGNLDSYMSRERVVRRTWYQWVGLLHENLLDKDRFARMARDDRQAPIQVRHNTDRTRQMASGKRCLEIATKAVERERAAGKIDPRTVLDMGRALMATGIFDKAIETLEDYTRICGWDDMRYFAFNLMADMHRDQDRYERAKECNHMAMMMKPKWPDACLGLAKTAFREHSWQDVIFWCEMITKCEKPAGVIPCDPTSWTSFPLKLLHYAYGHLGDFPRAIIMAEKALEFYPSDQTIQKCLKGYRKGLHHIQLQKALVEIKEWLEEHGEDDKLQHFVKAIPNAMADEPTFVRLKNQLYPRSSKNRIVIYCGKSYETWGPQSVHQGIGGSEEAVIYLAPLLAKQGWVVDVYGNPEEEVQANGVNWKHWHTYDREFDPPDIFIAWRNPEYIEYAPKRPAKCFLWCHDVVLPNSWNDSFIERVDKVFVLSKYHRTFFDLIPEEKIFYTRNGIVLKDFVNDLPRVPGQCIYMSSPDRGLEILLRGWSQITEAVPHATLKVGYGFTKNYDEKNRGNYVMTQFKVDILNLCQQPGIEYLGRVSHAEVARLCLTSDLWTYPCTFSEISCISAMKAQAGGVVPVVSDFAALAETVQHGVRLKAEGLMEQEYINAVIASLKAPKQIDAMREPMREWAHREFSWETVAKQWGELFNQQAVPVGSE